MEGHTNAPLPDLVRQDAKYREHLNHDLDHDVLHGRCRSGMYVRLEALKKVIDAVKDVYKSILARWDIRYRLGVIRVTKAYMPDDQRNAHLEENADSGKNGIRCREYLSHRSEGIYRVAYSLDITSPTALPRVAENEHKTLTVGRSHFVNLPSTP